MSTRLFRHPAQPTSPFETAYRRRSRIDAIPHRLIATLALVPHPQQGRMPRAANEVKADAETKRQYAFELEQRGNQPHSFEANRRCDVD